MQKHNKYTYSIIKEHRDEIYRTTINIAITWMKCNKNLEEYTQTIFNEVFKVLFPLEIDKFNQLLELSKKYNSIREFIISKEYENFNCATIIKAYFQSYLFHKIQGLIWEEEQVNNILAKNEKNIVKSIQDNNLDYTYFIDLLLDMKSNHRIAFQFKNMSSKQINLKYEISKFLSGVNKFNQTNNKKVHIGYLVFTDRKIKLEIRGNYD